MSLFYDDPVHLVRGEGVWLWDADGRKYLDCYNNVPHVGHCHPRVVEAITRQASMLNTHTRYLHEGILDYVERLTATFDKSLNAAILTCTGSEANDVALRMAQAVTGKTGVIATNHTYHGNTTAVSQLSTRMPPVGGFGGHVRHVPAPDSYRPLGGEGGDAFATAFAAEVEKAIASLQDTPHGFSAIIIDPFFANEGFPDLPPGFLDKTVAAVRKAGGLVITDEVQPGFGRTGSHMWGHQPAGIVPDIVTLGKPMANGHPVGGVIANVDTINASARHSAISIPSAAIRSPVRLPWRCSMSSRMKNSSRMPAMSANTPAMPSSGWRRSIRSSAMCAAAACSWARNSFWTGKRRSRPLPRRHASSTPCANAAC